MSKKSKSPRRKNAADATLRNVQAANRRHEKLCERLKEVEDRVTKMEIAVNNIESAFAQQG
jgi:hypothetical protein